MGQALLYDGEFMSPYGKFCLSGKADKYPEFKFEVIFDDGGILYTHLDWCAENCSHYWGWYFLAYEKRYSQPFTAILRFESKTEAIKFKLSCW